MSSRITRTGTRKCQIVDELERVCYRSKANIVEILVLLSDYCIRLLEKLLPLLLDTAAHRPGELQFWLGLYSGNAFYHGRPQIDYRTAIPGLSLSILPMRGKYGKGVSDSRQTDSGNTRQFMLVLGYPELYKDLRL